MSFESDAFQKRREQKQAQKAAAAQQSLSIADTHVALMTQIATATGKSISEVLDTIIGAGLQEGFARRARARLDEILEAVQVETPAPAKDPEPEPASEPLPPDPDEKRCESCRGTGTIISMDEGHQTFTDCPTCNNL